jgi:hypothetical protein
VRCELSPLSLPSMIHCRIANERETLPSHYQTILQERLTYVNYLEESLLKREESLKVEQQRNNLILETIKNEIRSDWEKREVMLRMELEQERYVSLSVSRPLCLHFVSILCLSPLFLPVLLLPSVYPPLSPCPPSMCLFVSSRDYCPPSFFL